MDGNTLHDSTVKDNVSLIDRQALSGKHAPAAASRSGSLAPSVSSLAKLEKWTVDEPTNAARGNSQKGIDASSISEVYPSLPASRASSSAPSMRSLAKRKEPRVDKSGSEAGGNRRKAVDKLPIAEEDPLVPLSRFVSVAPSARSLAKGKESRGDQSRSDRGSLPRNLSSLPISRDDVSTAASRSSTPASSVASLAKRKESRVDISRNEGRESRTRDINETSLPKDDVPAAVSRSSTRALTLDRLPEREEPRSRDLSREGGGSLRKGIPSPNESEDISIQRADTTGQGDDDYAKDGYVIVHDDEKVKSKCHKERPNNRHESHRDGRFREANLPPSPTDEWVRVSEDSRRPCPVSDKSNFTNNDSTTQKLRSRSTRLVPKHTLPVKAREAERSGFGRDRQGGADIVYYYKRDDGKGRTSLPHQITNLGTL